MKASTECRKRACSLNAFAARTELAVGLKWETRQNKNVQQHDSSEGHHFRQYNWALLQSNQKLPLMVLTAKAKSLQWKALNWLHRLSAPRTKCTRQPRASNEATFTPITHKRIWIWQLTLRQIFWKFDCKRWEMGRVCVGVKGQCACTGLSKACRSLYVLERQPWPTETNIRSNVRTSSPALSLLLHAYLWHHDPCFFSSALAAQL